MAFKTVTFEQLLRQYNGVKHNWGETKEMLTRRYVSYEEVKSKRGLNK